MAKKFEVVFTVVLVCCALVITALVVRRELFQERGAADSYREPKFIEDWKTVAASGQRIGPADAPVQIVEFGDFECLGCQIFSSTLDEIWDRYPDKVSLTFVHFPLANHRFAVPAARAAECAAEQNRFEAMYRVLYARQGDFGLNAWSEFAGAAQVPDLKAFDACVGRRDAPQGIIEGKRIGKQLQVSRVPTLIVNGWQLGSAPDLQQMDLMVKDILDGRSPIASLPKKPWFGWL